MKKTILLMVMAIMACGTVSAQRNRGEQTPEQRAQQRAQRIERQTESMVKELGIKDDAEKAAFTETYKKYQEELQAVNESAMQGFGRQEEKKVDKMTDEECYAGIKEALGRQESMATQATKRLEITKKYMAEFMTTLTPQQLYKVFGQQRGFGGMSGMGGNRGGGFNGGMGGFGGGGMGGFGGGMGGGF